MRPNFLIIGAPRSGTTALYEGLAQHPEIFMSPRKEPWFAGFTGDPGPWMGPRDAQPVIGWADYERLFEGAGDANAVGEASTLYLASPEAPQRIKDSLPNVRLIAILRNPVDRAYSNFLEHVQEGRESELNFARAIAAEPERRRRGWAPSWAYTGLGFYGAQLNRYFAQFPRDRMLVLLHDDLKQDRDALFRHIFDFLSVDSGVVPALPPRTNENSGFPRSRLLHAILTRPNPLRSALRSVLDERQRKVVRAWLLRRTLDRPQLERALRTELIELFRADILRTGELVGRDLSAWLTV
ncbi:MAG: sulfotransferase [Thermaerobacter sp.]|nr:sulfotransferase [Thermaerobacter sp.]